jgi:hypothetical protein
MDFNQLQSILANIQGCTFAGLDTVTVPVLLGGKKNPMQGKVEKHCLGHRVMLFTNAHSNGYANKVRRHLEKEGKNPDSFELGPLPWGERLPNSPIIHNKGKHYLQCVFLAAGSIQYFRRIDDLDDLRSGLVPIAKDAIEGLNERSGSEHQGLDNEVIVRTYALDSIVALRAFGEELE